MMTTYEDLGLDEATIRRLKKRLERQRKSLQRQLERQQKRLQRTLPPFLTELPIVLAFVVSVALSLATLGFILPH